MIDVIEILRPPQKRTCGAVGERVIPWMRSRAKIRWDLVIGEPDIPNTLTKGPSPARRSGSVFGEVWKAREVMGEALARCWTNQPEKAAAGIEMQLGEGLLD